MKKIMIVCFVLTTMFSSCQLVSSFLFGYTSSFSTPTQNFDVESDKTAPPATANTLNILLSNDDKVYVYQGFDIANGKICTTSEPNTLRKEIETYKAATPKNDFNILIKEHEKFAYSTFVNVLDEMQINKVEKKAVVNMHEGEIEYMKNINLLK